MSLFHAIPKFNMIKKEFPNMSQLQRSIPALTSFSMLIGGKTVESKRKLGVINPANEQVFSHAPICEPSDLDQAVALAKHAFPSWSMTSYQQRTELLRTMSDIICSNVEDLKFLLSAEQGKSHKEARFEILASCNWLKAMADMTLPVQVNESTDARLSETRRVPIGVVAAISPWNFPVLLSFSKISPALAAGNCIVVKPSPFTPLTMLRIGELIKDVLPPGVLNIISGDDDLGPMLTSHSGIDKISFTGSTETGKRVMHSAAEDIKGLTLELGGNDVAIVLPDADINKCVSQIAWGTFRNTGQICINSKRIYVHSDCYDRFAKAFLAQIKLFRIGAADEPGAVLGPVQNQRQYDRVIELIEDCKNNGYRFLTGGDVDSDAAGYFLPLSVIDNPPKNSRIVLEEPFGPIVPLMKYNDLEALIKDVNSSDYGLAGSVWGEDLETATHVAEKLQTGTVWINEIHKISPFEPMAGHKQSGFGVENGIAGLMEYTLPKTITINRRYAYDCF